MKKNLLTVLICFGLIVSQSNAQDMAGTMVKLAGDAAKEYVNPIVTGFGADLNGGWFHKAPASKMLGFDLEFGLVAMGTFPSDAAKKIPDGTSGAFRFSGGYYSGDFVHNPSGEKSQAEIIAQNIPNWNLIPVTNKQDIIDKISAQDFSVGITGGTIVGSKTDTIKIVFPGKTIDFGPSGTRDIPGSSVAIPDVAGLLENVSVIPLAAPQLSLGTFVGTQFTFRYLPEVEVSKEVGKFKYFGFGIQHNPGIWFPNPLPVDISASFFTQKLSVGTLFVSKATAFGINVSKTFGPGALNVTPYAGFMLESSTMTFDYTAKITNSVGTTDLPIHFELEGANKSRLTLGLSLKLLFLNINADYNLGKNNSATAGLMFII
ncbi:MAG: hypothetical protein PHP42_06860 [Bacteroidota bacterium]|nr:hypothetical protein [Bacteroidota bacterium]